MFSFETNPLLLVETPSNLLEFTKRLIELMDYDLETCTYKDNFYRIFFRFRE